MTANDVGRGRRTMKLAHGIVGMALALMLSGPVAWAQGAAADAKPDSRPIETFYLTDLGLTTVLRNLLDPSDKVYFVPGENAVFVQGSPEQIALARKLLSDLDRFKKTYRLTYTIAESDAGKRVGVQHFSMIVVTGQRTTLKQGSKVPVATGSYTAATSQTQTQMTYLDVGMNFDATLDEFANGVRLNSKVEQSSIAEEKSAAGAEDPIVRQTVLQGTSFLTQGKPLILGSLDVPGSTRHLDIEVVMELVK